MFFKAETNKNNKITKTFNKIEAELKQRTCN